MCNVRRNVRVLPDIQGQEQVCRPRDPQSQRGTPLRRKQAGWASQSDTAVVITALVRPM